MCDTRKGYLKKFNIVKLWSCDKKKNTSLKDQKIKYKKTLKV